MKKFMMVVAAWLSLGLLAQEADAKRLGGGSSIGRQRSTITQPPAKPPAQQAPSAAPATPAQQPSGMSRWLGPLAGLAIGAGLASLFFHNGLGGALAGILLIAALVMGAVLLVRLLRGGRTAQGPLRYAGATPYSRTEPTSAPRAARPRKPRSSRSTRKCST